MPQPESDGLHFALYPIVRDITLIDKPTEPYVLARVKCDNFGPDTKAYPGSGSLHFYVSPDNAPRVGETLEVTVTPWKQGRDETPTPNSEE